MLPPALAAKIAKKKTLELAMESAAPVGVEEVESLSASRCTLCASIFYSKGGCKALNDGDNVAMTAVISPECSSCRKEFITLFLDHCEVAVV